MTSKEKRGGDVRVAKTERKNPTHSSCCSQQGNVVLSAKADIRRPDVSRQILIQKTPSGFDDSQILLWQKMFNKIFDHTHKWTPDSPDVFWTQVEIESINKNFFSKRRLAVLTLEVKVGRVREGVDARVGPAGDFQRHRVEWPQPLYCLLCKKTTTFEHK